jgi:hypothetical protein
MSDVETPLEEANDTVIVDEEILEITILDDGVDEEPVAESAFDRPGRWYIVHTFAGHEHHQEPRAQRVDLRDLPARRGRHRVQIRQEGDRL